MGCLLIRLATVLDNIGVCSFISRVGPHRGGQNWIATVGRQTRMLDLIRLGWLRYVSKNSGGRYGFVALTSATTDLNGDYVSVSLCDLFPC